MKRRKRTDAEKGTGSGAILSMENALEAVKEGEMGVNRAVLEFGVPKTTLKD